MKALITTLILLLNFFFGANDFVITQRSLNYVREGAGSFYKLVSILPANTKLKIISEKDNWLEVEQGNGQKGWISRYSATKTEKKDIKPFKSDQQIKNITISKVGMSAAIKGLKGKSELRNINKESEIESIIENNIDLQEFNSFEKTFKNDIRNNSIMESVKIDNRMVYAPTLDEIIIGNQVAARIMQNRLLVDKKVNSYANLILSHIVNSNPFFDYEFRVFIIDTTIVDGLACPGGVIFLTLGAIKQCEDESQFAGLLCHEISHIINRDGLEEILKRKVAIKADEAFSEISSEQVQDEKELEEYSEKAYEKIVHSRLLKYEIDADKNAINILKNAGYNVQTYYELIKKLADTYIKNEDIFSNDFLSPDDLGKRREELYSFHKIDKVEKPGETMKDRFIKNIK